MTAPHTGCPLCLSDDYLELDDPDPDTGAPVYRCEKCGEEWS